MFFYHGSGFGWIFLAAMVVAPFWRICARAGHPPALSLLILVPLVNVAFVYYLAFGGWPVEGGASSTDKR